MFDVMSTCRCSKLRACIALTLIGLYVLVYSVTHISDDETKVPSSEDQITTTHGISPEVLYHHLELSLCLKPVYSDRRGLVKVPCPTAPIVTVAQGGRLCNQIWEYAAVWATAKATGLRPFVPGCIRDNIDPMFQDLSVPSFDRIRHCGVSRAQYVPSIKTWSEGYGILLPMWSTESEVVLRYLPQLRKEFRIRRHWLEMAQDEIQFALDVTGKSEVTLIGVHVRRTDYISYLQRKFNITAAGPKFYTEAMRIFRRKYRKVLFMVVSDEPDWCWRHLGNFSDVYVSGRRRTNYPEVDLTIMSLCNHSIIDYGTYGAWGALMAGGETIYHQMNDEYLTTKMARILSNWYTL